MKFAPSKIQTKKRKIGNVIKAALLVGVGSAANAAPMYIDLGTIDDGDPNKYDSARALGTPDPDSATGVFTEFGFSQLVATSVYDFSDSSIFGSFFDTNNPTNLAAIGVPDSGTPLSGTGTVSLVVPDCLVGQCDIDALSPLVPPLVTDNEGVLQTWDLQVEYTFDGTLTAGGPVYTSGTFEVTFNSLIPGQEADNQVVLRGSLTGSNVEAANLNLFFDVEFALDGFLFVERGGSFIDAGLNDLVSGSTNPVTLTLDTNVDPAIPTTDELLLVGDNAIRQSNLDGSVTAQIPTPGTVALMGLGMISLGAGLARRRRKA